MYAGTQALFTRTLSVDRATPPPEIVRGLVLSITTRGELFNTEMVWVLDVTVPHPFVASIVKVDVPVVVGVPEIVPEEDSDSPAGRDVPEVTLYVVTFFAETVYP
jgi:hypothetical protein